MRNRHYWLNGLLVFVASFVVVVPEISAQRSLHARSQRHVHPPEKSCAVASLEAADGSSGWGRLVVCDGDSPEHQLCSLHGWLFELAPSTDYTLVIDATEVLSLTTNDKGNAVVALSEMVEICSVLTPVEELQTVSLVDGDGGLVLQGQLGVVSLCDAVPVYGEEIVLDCLNGSEAQGVAAVGVFLDGHEKLTTRAKGLQPGQSYHITANEVEVGIVTADQAGHAALEMQRPDITNPLPAALPPVNEIGVIEWQDSQAEVWLRGTFAGDEPLCLEGRFLHTTPEGFIAAVHGQELAIVVNDATTFEGFDSLDQLQSGTWVEIKGSWDGNALIASVVGAELEEEPEHVSLVGVCKRLTPEGFILHAEHQTYRVVVTDATVLEGFDALDQLREGTRVEVEGLWDGEVVIASTVTADLEPEEEPIALAGVILSCTADGFKIIAGGTRYLVVITDHTVLEGFDSLDQLYNGLRVEVDGVWNGEVVTALTVAAHPEPEDEPVSLVGVLLARTHEGFKMLVGGAHYRVVVTEQTVFQGFDSLDQLREGTRVEVEGMSNGEVVTASTVAADPEPEEEPVSLVGAFLFRTNDGFKLLVGDARYHVVVTDQTVFEGFDSLDQLREGTRVEVEGLWDGEVVRALTVAADPEPEEEPVTLTGVFVLHTHEGFKLLVDDTVYLVVVCEETIFEGFESLDQLEEGVEVEVHGLWNGRFVTAAMVRATP